MVDYAWSDWGDLQRAHWISVGFTYVQRLNRLADLLPVLIEQMLDEGPCEALSENVRIIGSIIDSMSIIMACLSS